MSPAAKTYVRLTFTPAGAARRKTVWAIVRRRAERANYYLQVSAEGDESFDTGETKPDGLGGRAAVEEQRLIVAAPHEVKEQPARYSNHYGELVVIGSNDDKRAASYEAAHGARRA